MTDLQALVMNRTVGLDRETFLAGIRADLGREAGDALAPAPAVDEALVRVVGRHEDPVERFCRRAAEQGVTVHRAEADRIADTVQGILSAIGARQVTISSAPGSSGTLRSAAARAGCRIIDWTQAEGLAAQYEADAGLTDTVAAIAESGTIVVDSGPGRSRGTFLVPPVHIALVPAGGIMHDLVDYLASRLGGDRPAATTLITGPSKTADIEGILITGVHGPRAVHVIVVEHER